MSPTDMKTFRIISENTLKCSGVDFEMDEEEQLFETACTCDVCVADAVAIICQNESLGEAEVRTMSSIEIVDHSQIYRR